MSQSTEQLKAYETRLLQQNSNDSTSEHISVNFLKA